MSHTHQQDINISLNYKVTLIISSNDLDLDGTRVLIFVVLSLIEDLKNYYFLII